MRQPVKDNKLWRERQAKETASESDKPNERATAIRDGDHCKTVMQLQGWAVHKFVNARQPLTAEFNEYTEKQKEGKH